MGTIGADGFGSRRVPEGAHPRKPRQESLTPEERTLRGRLGAYLLHARHDPRETTAAAREAFSRRFLDEVDPERRLPTDERLRRAAAARSAHFTRLALLAAQRRRQRGRRNPKG